MSQTGIASKSSKSLVLNCRGRILDCRPENGPSAHVAGILNVTPDSFYDGGKFLDQRVAMRRAEKILAEGAAIIDVGGASSRPRGATYGEGAEPVSAAEEWQRIGQILRSILRELPEAIVSVDTFHAQVADRALDAGAHLINDITALRHSPEIARLVAEAEAGLIVMHSIGDPGSMPHQIEYDDVVATVKEELAEACKVARDAGVRALVTDPGFGFGKNLRHNLELIAGVDSLLELDAPVMIGVSRKASVGAVLRSPSNPLPASERLYGSLGITAAGIFRGATLVRTHDVRETVEMIRAISAILASRSS